MKIRTLSLERKKAWLGVLFLTPWLFGFIFLLVIPLYQSIRFSLNKVTIEPAGYKLQFVGWDNFNHVFFVDPWFIRTLTNSVLDMVLNVPLIIFFSLFTASLLTQKFKGRMLARAVIFLPVVLASGAIATLDSGNYLASMIGAASSEIGGNYAGGVQNIDIRPLLIQSGMNMQIVGYLTSAVDRIYQIVSASGVQILIFLAALQSISPALYEAARIEGATGYEVFWKITFPMMTPFLLTNTIYSIIDSFYHNQVTEQIRSVAFNQLNFGVSSAMAWVYFFVISVILLISAYIISKRVSYYD
ncbi:carbohydrate ABC transporter permease [Paenibacillus sp. GCM10027626]|uniref:carbohydrate ABC transporter permease n=1 Tax=Paenibacillus sp. GCM10027626 TaxID=3273411 RepID=UPI00362B0A3A